MKVDCLIGALAVALAALALPGAASAASFDCARAASPIEKRICADAQLSRDDEALAASYARALAIAPLPFAVREEQRSWIGEVRDKAATNAELHAALVARATELAMQAAADTVAAQPVPLATIATRCTAPRSDSGACRVEGSGRFPAAHLVWQRRIYQDGDTRTASGVTVYAVEGANARPVVWRDEEYAWFDDPTLITTNAGQLLDLGGHLDGTGNYSVEAILAADGQAWRQLDMTGIQRGLEAHVPRGRAIWKGLYPDWRRMTVDSPLWKGTDGNCCPTGGTVHGTLKRAGQRIVVDRATYDPKPLAD
ncbi:hypothetical protein QH494_27690 [Sphingomonas sp. AR_OL41]|uniref:lysozyme inhibitor LprI family protein n=1 Tax=Sphingomonas sp. AR_OL41 TaxID=3042729 RepID=UPI002480C042|nr:hypothetical protein [Sphingomonas sp. AR_OL41]MDH7975977.1 hypothetical protein [Sphingomonas sp. AR_OL41]